MDLTKDLNEEIIVHRMGLYSVKRYAYNESISYVEHCGSPIKERVFSFILMRGPRWFNSTNLNFKESELNQVIVKYENILSKMTKERKELLTIERAARKLLPRKHEFIFDNVKIVAIEKPCYYTQGIARTHGNYFEPKEKIVELYANGLPYRKEVHTSIDTEINANFILFHTIENYLQRNYSKNNFKDKYVSEETQKFDFSYIPAIALVGYVYEFQGENIKIFNLNRNHYNEMIYLKTQNSDRIELSLYKLMSEAKPIGEIQGHDAFEAFLNKVKFI